MHATQIIEFLTRLLKGLLQGAKDITEAIFIMIRAVLRQYLPNSGRVFLETISISNIEDLRNGLESWLSTRVKGDFFKAQGVCHNHNETRRGEKSNKSDKHVRDGARWEGRPSCTVCGKVGHKAEVCWYRGADHKEGAASPNVDQVTGSYPRPRVPVYYTCRKEGHKSPDCPSKGKAPVRKEKSKEEAHLGPVSITVPKKEKNVIKGKVNGKPVDTLIDSGADYGLVPKALVPQSSYCGQSCQVTGITNATALYELAKVEFELPGVKLTKKVLVDEKESPSPWCLLPLDIADVGELQVFLNVMHEGSVCVLTRNQAKAEAALVNEEDIVSDPCEINKNSNINNPSTISNSHSEEVEAVSRQAVSSSSGDEVIDEVVNNTNDDVPFIHSKDAKEEAVEEEPPSGPQDGTNELEGGSTESDPSQLSRGDIAEESGLESSVDDGVSGSLVEEPVLTKLSESR